MLRAILEGVLLFVLPFAGFAIYLLLIGQNPLHPEVWSKKALSWLTIAALVVCIAGVIVVGAGRQLESGTFVPSHVDESGRFVPGGFRRAP
jgi:cytochrome bd-type quinol oxidase subunit 1